jgi:hypothetical protein
VFARIDHKFDLTCTLINKRAFVHWYVGEDLATLEDYQASKKWAPTSQAGAHVRDAYK